MLESASASPRTAGPLALLERSPILIIGDAHTGATWVSAVLSAHPQVAGLSELRLFTAMGLEPPFRETHWDPESAERMFDRRMGFGQFLSRERVVADLRDLSDRWLARALSPEHRFLVERSPAGAPGVRAFASLYPDGLVIHVLRDGRDVARSIIAEQDRHPPSTEQDGGSPAAWRLLWSMGYSWAAHLNALREFAKTAPVAFHELRYEHMHAGPLDIARDLFELCGIPCEEDLLAQILAQVGPPPQTGPRGLSRRERAMYGAGAGELLHELGYAPAPAPGVRLLRRALLGYERAKQVV